MDAGAAGVLRLTRMARLSSATRQSFVTSEEEGKECGVCLEELKVGDEVRVTRSCRHSFHPNCIYRWLSHGAHSCPFCRRALFTIRTPPAAAAPATSS